MNTLLSLILSASFLAPTSANDSVDRLLAAISGGNAGGAVAAVKEFLGEGRDAFAGLVVDVVDHMSLHEDEAGQAAIARDARARAAISGLVHVATRPEGESERRILAPLVAREAMRRSHSTNVRRFFLEQLGFVGGDDEVAVLGTVSESDVALAMVRTLQTIGSEKARSALRMSYSQNSDENARSAIVQALGALRDEDSKMIFVEWARGKGDRSLGYIALGRIGDLESSDLLFDAAISDASTHDKRLAVVALLEMAELNETSATERVGEIYDRLWESAPETRDRHVRIAALRGIARVRGSAALPALLAAIDGEDPQIRAAATEVGASMHGDGVTAAWVNGMENASAGGRTAILRVLAGRNDRGALPAVFEALGSDEPEVKKAAMSTLVDISGSDAVEPLLDYLGARDKDMRQHAITVLTHSRHESLSAAMATSFAEGSPSARRGLVEILAARRARDQIDTVFVAASDPDASVRRTAFGALGALVRVEHLPRFAKIISGLTARDLEVACRGLSSACSRLRGPERASAIVEEIETAPDAVKVQLLGVLVSVGDRAALDRVRDARRDENPDIRDAAVRALASWPHEDAIALLLGIAQEPEQDVHGVLALRGAVRLLETSSLQNRQRVAALKHLLGTTDRLDERRLILTGLSRVRSVDSLLLASEYLDDEKLSLEAEFAIVQIVCPRNANDPGLRTPEAATVLRKLVSRSSNKKLKERAQKHLQSIGDGQGFVPLFNGRDLDGWQGAVRGYAVENGAMVCRKGHGGNLYTASEYGNFVLRFEFQLAVGSNNGLGLRTPLEGDPAYVGMESQILDNTAEKFKNLEPYQVHGSIYGVVPAKRGHLAPVGSWNRQQVSVSGRHVIVKLNDAIIVDANLDEASRDGTIDGREHPGLARERGYIGFLGHGDWVAFRNIRIKLLD